MRRVFRGVSEKVWKCNLPHLRISIVQKFKKLVSVGLSECFIVWIGKSDVSDLSELTLHVRVIDLRTRVDRLGELLRQWLKWLKSQKPGVHSHTACEPWLSPDLTWLRRAWPQTIELKSCFVVAIVDAIWNLADITSCVMISRYSRSTRNLLRRFPYTYIRVIGPWIMAQSSSTTTKFQYVSLSHELSNTSINRSRRQFLKIYALVRYQPTSFKYLTTRVLHTTKVNHGRGGDISNFTNMC